MTHSIGPVMLDLEGSELAAHDHALLQHDAVGGVILFARNIQNADQVRALCDDIRQVRPDLLIAVDQEGGRVQRIKQGVTRLPPMSLLGQYYLQDPLDAVSLAKDTGWLLGMEMAACGLDMTFAPVLDVDGGTSSVIGDRSFGPHPQQVAELGLAFIQGLHDAGMAAIGKHFPGHGSVAEDSHIALPVDERPLDSIKQHDLVPFTQLASVLDGVMPAHVIFPAFDHRPAGFSPAWLGMLRESLNFKGCIFSDDLSMVGAHAAGSPAGRGFAALQAGCDILLLCNDREAAIELLDSCAGRRTQRPLTLRYQRTRPTLASLSAMERWQRTHVRLEGMAAAVG